MHRRTLNSARLNQRAEPTGQILEAEQAVPVRFAVSQEESFELFRIFSQLLQTRPSGSHAMFTEREIGCNDPRGIRPRTKAIATAQVPEDEANALYQPPGLPIKSNVRKIAYFILGMCENHKHAHHHANRF